MISFCYLVTTTAALGFGLLTVVDTTLTNILGPGLALRGKEGAVSVHKAVDFMYKEQNQYLVFFIFQLIFFHISSFLLMWVLYSRTVAIAVNIVQLIFLIIFTKDGFDIVSKLYVSNDTAITG